MQVNVIKSFIKQEKKIHQYSFLLFNSNRIFSIKHLLKFYPALIIFVIETFRNIYLCEKMRTAVRCVQLYH